MCTGTLSESDVEDLFGYDGLLYWLSETGSATLTLE